MGPFSLIREWLGEYVGSHLARFTIMQHKRSIIEPFMQPCNINSMCTVKVLKRHGLTSSYGEGASLIVFIEMQSRSSENGLQQVLKWHTFDSYRVVCGNVLCFWGAVGYSSLLFGYSG